MPESKTQSKVVTIRRKMTTFELEDDTGCLRGLSLLSFNKGVVSLSNGRVWVTVSKLCGGDIYTPRYDALGAWTENIGMLGVLSQVSNE